MEDQPVDAILTALRLLGAVPQMEGESLVIRMPRAGATLPPALRAAITAHKPAIVARLSGLDRICVERDALEPRVAKGIETLRAMEERGEMDTPKYRAWFAGWKQMYDRHELLLNLLLERAVPRAAA